MRADPSDVETSAFEGLPTAAGSGRGVVATEREGLGIARIAAHWAKAARLSERYRAQFGAEPVFEIWAGRSLAVSLHQAISHSAAEFGFVREPAV